jgi:hypothetical protein
MDSMTTTSIIGTTIRCNGVNHSDTGKITNCKKCGAYVARREDGKVFGVQRYTTEYGNERFNFSCYTRSHSCNPERVEEFQAAVQRSIAAGEMVPGQQVVVARGRKVPQGTTGKITWVGENEWGPRARVQPESGEAFFIPTKNLDVR